VSAAAAGIAPPAGCSLCPRLVEFRGANRRQFPDWHNDPVPAFGALAARLLVVGLAPGLRGANRTGRPFTGDYAGDTLYAALKKHGFAEGSYGAAADDGFTLVECRITNAVRCVPPENKPLPPEIAACRSFLAAEFAAMPNLRIILALGAIAHQTIVATFALKKSAYKFAHGALHALPGGRLLADSYHCSRYNTNTGRLTEAMFDQVVGEIRRRLDKEAAG
jgi:uracil-DNA glycosylase family 4